MTLEESVTEYGADAIRIAFADAGDTLDDANNTILRLANIETWIKSQDFSKLREGSSNEYLEFVDRAFANEMSRCVLLAAFELREIITIISLIKARKDFLGLPRP